MTVDMDQGEARDVAISAYTYLYPLVLMEVTRLQAAVELYLEEVDDPVGHITATPLVTSFRLPAA